MKSSKKSKIVAILAIALLLGLNSYDAFARGPRHHAPRPPRHHNDGGQHGGGNNVGAPLDAGILTVLLGGAGAAYFAMKKRRNQKSE